MERTMKKRYKKPIGAALSTMVLLFVLSSCETWHQDCTGQIIVENPMADTTLYVGGEPFLRDIFEAPEVFKHTENKDLTIMDLIGDTDFVALNIVENPSTKSLDIIKITGIKAEESIIRVVVGDNCSDEGAFTEFRVVVASK